MSDRGEYRSIYVSFWDDAEQQALSHPAYRVLTNLKGVLPATGIGIIYRSQLAERCGLGLQALDAALAELELPKPGEQYGWIVRERNIVWLVNGLRFEPTLTPTNRFKHVPFVRRLVAALGEKSAIVRAFRAYYVEWFEGPVAAPTHSPSASNGTARSSPPGKGTDRLSDRKATDSLSIHSTSSSSHNYPKTKSASRDLDQERAVSTSAPTNGAGPPGAAPPAAPPTALAVAPARNRAGGNARRFLAKFYGARKGMPLTARQAEVQAQLLELLTPRGARFEKADRVRAASPEHLDACCRAVLEDPPKKADAAIRILMLKLRDTYGDELRAVEQHERATDERSAGDELADAEVWLAQHPEAEALVEERIHALAPADLPPGDFGDVGRRIVRNAAVQAVHRSGQR